VAADVCMVNSWARGIKYKQTNHFKWSTPSSMSKPGPFMLNRVVKDEVVCGAGCCAHIGAVAHPPPARAQCMEIGIQRRRGRHQLLMHWPLELELDAPVVGARRVCPLPRGLAASQRL